jgi:hypothetical protein
MEDIKFAKERKREDEDAGMNITGQFPLVTFNMHLLKRV